MRAIVEPPFCATHSEPAPYAIAVPLWSPPCRPPRGSAIRLVDPYCASTRVRYGLSAEFTQTAPPPTVQPASLPTATACSIWRFVGLIFASDPPASSDHT